MKKYKPMVKLNMWTRPTIPWKLECEVNTKSKREAFEILDLELN